MRILIATATRPLPGKAPSLFALMRKWATEDGLTIPPGMLWVPGPGCTNLAMDILGDDTAAEKFANQITIALMASRWCITSDPLPTEDTYKEV